eukprot:5398625-Amphidinium_carterae.2
MDDSDHSEDYWQQEPGKLIRSLLPANAKGESPVTVKLAKGKTSATTWRHEGYVPSLSTPLAPDVLSPAS